MEKMKDSKSAVLILEDGTIVRGCGFGAEDEACGEVVFNTSMTGYQEALTDPSYKYQILMPTYPLIGNYGINRDDFESKKIQAEGLIVREFAENPVHGKLEKTLDEFLKDYGIPGISGVDTRFLTKKIRAHGVMNGILKYPYEDSELDELAEKARNLESISNFDLVDMVTTKEVKRYDAEGSNNKTIALIDCGEKQSIINSLLKRNINVIRVPAKTTADEILNYSPDGIMISNGPGDPKRSDYVVHTVRELMNEKIPMFGICLGIQIISLACGAETYKLKFGHRGSNQPVKDLKTGKVYITSQNHGFAVDAKSAKNSNLEVSHVNLNDESVEGVRHNELPVFAVQYHPEAHPGPWDNYYLFDEFLETMKKQ
jgi:carbamoyl-phosphate synthase small subunit